MEVRDLLLEGGGRRGEGGRGREEEKKGSLLGPLRPSCEQMFINPAKDSGDPFTITTAWWAPGTPAPTQKPLLPLFQFTKKTGESDLVQ